MTRDELVEKVARVIDAEAHNRFDADNMLHPSLVTDEKMLVIGRINKSRAIARSALSVIYEAMKEPSEEMLLRLYDGPNTSTRIWKSMLSASPLSDKQEG